MRRLILPMIAVLLFALSSIAADDPSRWAPGMVLIEVEATELGDPIIDNDGFVTTGWPELDLAIRDIKINRWERIIPIAPNPQYRERWRWTERWFQFYFDPDVTDVPTAVEALRGLKGVKLVEPNYRGAHSAVPSDPYYWSKQWYTRKIFADRVWDFTQGEPTILLSAVDSGVDYLHEDLTNLIWQNLGEDINGDGRVLIPGVGFDPADVQQSPDSVPNMAYDTDGNGYIDDFIGYDFVTGVYTDAYRHPTDPFIKEDGLDYDNDPNDFRYNGHGTHCTGTMTAQANNGVGIAGITWRTRIMCLRAGYYSRTCNGYNQNEAVLKGLQYGLMMGCKIFNFSYGGDDSSHFVHAMIDTAVNSWGAIITAAAGNDDVSDLHYPSAYPEVIAVAATNQSDQKTYFSNYNSTVDLSAPGIDIGATVPRFYESPPAPCNMGWTSNFAPGYAEFQGTSMAAPVVAGCAGLLWSFFPDSSNHWIRSRLENYSDYIYDVPGNGAYAVGEQLGKGRVNVFKALAAGIFPSLTLTEVNLRDANLNGRPEPDEEVIVTLTYQNSTDPTWAAATGVQVTVTSSDSLVIILDSTASIGTIPRGASGSNTTDQIVFKMNPAYRYGRFVTFDVTLTTPDRYVLVSQFKVMVGYPEVLVASVDTSYAYINKVMGSLRWGGVPYDSIIVPTAGLSRAIMDRHRVIIFITGDFSGMELLPGASEANFESWLGAEPNRMLIMSGQHLPEVASSAWLERVFGTRHMVDVVPLTLAMNLTGVTGDIIGDGIIDNIAFGGGSAVNQRFMGSCSAVSGGIPVFFYNAGTLSDSTCAVRFQTTSGSKTIFLEFGIEGFSDSLRNTFIQRAMAWAGVPYFWDIKEVERPYSLILMPPFPNPFNSSVTIGFDIPEDAEVKIEIFDINGRIVRDVRIPEAQAGPNLFHWNATLENGDKLSTGTYLYRVSALGKSAGGRIVYMK